MTENKVNLPIIAEEMIIEQEIKVENDKLKKEVEELRQKLSSLQVSNENLQNKINELEKGEWTSEEQKLVDILEATLPSFPNHITDEEFLEKKGEIERKGNDTMLNLPVDGETERVSYYNLMAGKAFYIFQRGMKSLKA